MPNVVHQGLDDRNEVVTPNGHRARYGLEVISSGIHYIWNDRTRWYDIKASSPPKPKRAPSRFNAFVERTKRLEKT